jgi:hypothetical protein
VAFSGLGLKISQIVVEETGETARQLLDSSLFLAEVKDWRSTRTVEGQSLTCIDAGVLGMRAQTKLVPIRDRVIGTEKQLSSPSAHPAKELPVRGRERRPCIDL